MAENKFVRPITENHIAYCDRCKTVRSLNIKLENGHLKPVCEKCGYTSPNWKQP